VKATIYETITQQLVTAIEEGAEQYKMPRHLSPNGINDPCNAITNLIYRGLNVVTLRMIAEASQFATGAWATYRQWAEKGAHTPLRPAS